ncbi:hypothetical protein L3X38_041185 [Prunus dulcis]|uniref:Uncharacterized protein n=1 Tax=Prunus dulcis TaxID=3755 RepID=A0AAD4UU73_PRUDU|nr:hypothetical protein L3X38_041185 [Prunus dulcis]
MENRLSASLGLPSPNQDTTTSIPKTPMTSIASSPISHPKFPIYPTQNHIPFFASTTSTTTSPPKLVLQFPNQHPAQDPDFTEEPHGVRGRPHRRRHRRSLHLLLPPPSGHHQDEAPDQRRLRHLRKHLRRSPQDLPD